jgi:hypothetical protein
MPQLVFTMLHQSCLDCKAANVLNRDVFHDEKCANQWWEMAVLDIHLEQDGFSAPILI